MSKKFTIFIIILFTFAALFIGFLILKSYYPHSFQFFSEQDKKEREEDAKQIQYRLAYNDIKGNLTQTIALNKGQALFELEHKGAGKYSFILANTDGKLLYDIAGGEGDFKTKKFFEIPESDAYLLEVKTDGVWTFKYK